MEENKKERLEKAGLKFKDSAEIPNNIDVPEYAKTEGSGISHAEEKVEEQKAPTFSEIVDEFEAGYSTFETFLKRGDLSKKGLKRLCLYMAGMPLKDTKVRFHKGLEADMARLASLMGKAKLDMTLLQISKRFDEDSKND